MNTIRRLNKLLEYSCYVFVFFGIYFGFSALTTTSQIAALHIFSLIAILPLSLISSFNHFFSSGHFLDNSTP